MRTTFGGMEHLATEAVAAFVDGELGMGAYQRAAAHLSTCPECAADVDAQQRARTAVRSASAFAIPAALQGALFRIPEVAAVRVAPAPPTAAPTSADQPNPAPISQAPASPAPTRSRSPGPGPAPRGRRAFPAGVFAASVLAAGVLGAAVAAPRAATSEPPTAPVMPEAQLRPQAGTPFGTQSEPPFGAVFARSASLGGAGGAQTARLDSPPMKLAQSPTSP